MKQLWFELLVDILCRSTEKEYSERMVLNPIYNESQSSHENGEFRDRNLSVAQNPQYSTRAEVLPVHVTYETISDFPGRRKTGMANITILNNKHLLLSFRQE